MIQLSEILILVRNAGAAILRVYEHAHFEVTFKEDETPVTRADHDSNAVICAGLEDLYPDIPILSEENQTIPFSERAGYKMLWLVDPLDGTKEFIRRNGEFTINIALVEDQVPVAGVVYVPVTGDLYYALKGAGAFYENGNTKQALHVAKFRMTDPGLSVVCSRSHLNPETQAFIDSLHDPKTLSRGSALKFMLVASGQAHLYPRMAPTMEWDTAAAQCIIEEAGGFVVEYETRKPMRYNKMDLRNPYFLAGGIMEDIPFHR